MKNIRLIASGGRSAIEPRYRKPRRDWGYVVLGVAVWAALMLLTPLARALASYGW